REAAETRRFVELLGGQPYLTHRGIHELAASRLSFADLERSVQREDGIFSDHLRRLLVLLASDPELQGAICEMLRGRPCPSAGSFYRLWSAGLIAGDEPGAARLRCQLSARNLGRHLG